MINQEQRRKHRQFHDRLQAMVEGRKRARALRENKG